MNFSHHLLRRRTIGDALRNNARSIPQKTAITFYPPGESAGDGQKMTYRELNEAANRFAHGLYDLGLQKGDVAALMCNNCLDFVVAAFGFMKANITATFVNVSFVGHEIVHQIVHSEAKLLIVEDSLVEKILPIQEEIKGVEKFGYVNMAGKTVPEGWVEIKDIYSDRFSSDEPQVVIDPEDIIFRMYTSGTTSYPKGIDLTHHNMAYTALAWSGRTSGQQEDGVTGHFLPLYHGASMIIWSAITIGAHAIIGSMADDPFGVLDIIEKEQVTWIAIPVTLFERLIDTPLKDKMRSLKEISWFGGAMPLETLEKWFDFLPESNFRPQWNQTECYLGTTARFNKSTGLPLAGNVIGKPNELCEIKIVDEDDNEVPDGRPGEIAVRSPGVMKGYYKNKEATDHAFRNGWHHTEDVALRGEDGYYYFVDRVKDMIKTGGINVASMEVEAALNSMPGIGPNGSAVFGVYHPDWAEAVVAAVVKQDDSLTEKDVIDYCKTNLAKFKVPKRVIFVDEIPISHVGKVLRRDLRDTYKDFFRS